MEIKAIDYDSVPGKLNFSVKGQPFSLDVIYGPTCLNTKPRERSIWIKNIHGKVMAVPREEAIRFISERSYKFQPAKMDEIPMTPENKVYPMDSMKKREGQDKANTNLTGREVEELVNDGEEILVSEYSWPQLKKKAKELGVNTYQKTRMQIEEEVNEKLVSKN